MSNIGKRIALIEARIKKDKQEIFSLKAKERQDLRKARTKKLIQIGGLFEIVKLTDLEPGVILGLLIENQARLKDEATYKNLKRLGDAELNCRKQTRKQQKQGGKENAA